MKTRCSLLVVACIFGGHLRAADVAKSNFVVVFSDDQTYRAIGYNNPVVKTPNMDRKVVSPQY